MRGVTFNAWREGQPVSLHDLMRVLEPFVRGLTWKLRLDEVAPGPWVERLEAIGPEERLTTSEVLRLVTPDVQLIDGALFGYGGPGQEPPSLVLRAVDSTSWDVESASEEVLALVRRAWPDALDIPE
jgi:hypothetical protein